MPACRNSVLLAHADESGLHHDYEVWLERLAPCAPIDQAGPEAGCITVPARTPVLDVGTGCRCPPEAERNYQLRVMGLMSLKHAQHQTLVAMSDYCSLTSG